MGSSDSVMRSPLVSLALGQKVDLTELSNIECVQLLRGFLAHLQPCHKFLPAKSVQDITEHVRPLKDTVDIPRGHVYFQPVKYKGVSTREKCVDLEMTFGFVKTHLRNAHPESHRPLYWTRSGDLAVLTSYHSNDVAGTVAYDFVALTDQHLLQAINCTDREMLRLSRGMFLEIIISIQKIVEKMVAAREAEAQKQRLLVDTALEISNNLLVPKRAFSY